jgi:hypothetical protein
MRMSLATFRMPEKELQDLKLLAVEETIRRGKPTSIGTLLRESAQRIMKRAQKRGSNHGSIASSQVP